MSGQVTRFLAEWRAGDPQAIERLVPLVYDELRRLARRHLRREAAGHTLSPTALVHEVYLRLLRQRHLGAIDHDGFLAIAGVTMRRILVDYARERARLKRGGAGGAPGSLDAVREPALLTPIEAEEVLAVDMALDRLSRLDRRASRVVECRIFGGRTLDETGRALDLSTRSVQRSWTTALAWLRKEIGPDVAAAAVTWHQAFGFGPRWTWGSPSGAGLR